MKPFLHVAPLHPKTKGFTRISILTCRMIRSEIQNGFRYKNELRPRGQSALDITLHLGCEMQSFYAWTKVFFLSELIYYFDLHFFGGGGVDLVTAKPDISNGGSGLDKNEMTTKNKEKTTEKTESHYSLGREGYVGELIMKMPIQVYIIRKTGAAQHRCQLISTPTQLVGPSQARHYQLNPTILPTLHKLLAQRYGFHPSSPSNSLQTNLSPSGLTPLDKLPGATKDDVSLNLCHGCLTLSGIIKAPREHSSGKVMVSLRTPCDLQSRHPHGPYTLTRWAAKQEILLVYMPVIHLAWGENVRIFQKRINLDIILIHHELNEVFNNNFLLFLVCFYCKLGYPHKLGPCFDDTCVMRPLEFYISDLVDFVLLIWVSFNLFFFFFCIYCNGTDIIWIFWHDDTPGLLGLWSHPSSTPSSTQHCHPSPIPSCTRDPRRPPPPLTLLHFADLPTLFNQHSVCLVHTCNAGSSCSNGSAWPLTSCHMQIPRLLHFFPVPVFIGKVVAAGLSINKGKYLQGFCLAERINFCFFQSE
ncbi:hypothetical protein VP01_1958g1 [Puccinia sorghi]|uniref:Uncharacterized protein n=1 Tax=Puccinia sorghi TaxID=27349 RepID=A0A0L6VCJ0_9BASI|nr:hypothetical protein VP01_1958g1 [Puccinia sorghi]